MNEIVNERAATYGDVFEMYERTAKVFGAILGIEVQSWQASLMMAGAKLVRTSITPNYSDNSDDVDGYMDIFRTLIGEDMVHASSAAEYQAKLAEMHVPPPRICPNPDCGQSAMHAGAC